MTRGSHSQSTGLRPIMVSTVAAGVAGYLIQGLTGASLEPATFLRFSVFWSTLYLAIGALSGLQQETSRAARLRTGDPVPGAHRPASLRSFGLVWMGTVALLVGLTSPLWAPPLFPGQTLPLVVALVVGTASYAAVALLGGVFYGLRLWRWVATMTMVDAFLRLLLVGAALWLRAPLELIAAAVVAPLPLTLGVLWLLTRSRLRGRVALDVDPWQLAWNAGRTIGAAVSMGVLTSGYPLLIDATSRHEPAAQVGGLVFVVTLTRAPLVVPALALQSYLTVQFRDSSGRARRTLLVLLAALVGVTLVIAAGAYALEPWLLAALWGEGYVVSAAMCAGVVLTAGALAGLCISGSAVLAANRHGAFLTGWLLAAVAAVLMLVLPLGLDARVLLSMAVGPAVGIAVHLLSLAGAATRRTGP